MPLADDVGDLTKFMVSLAEDPAKLEEFRRDRAGFIEAARLSEGARRMLGDRMLAVDSNVIVVIIVVVVV